MLYIKDYGIHNRGNHFYNLLAKNVIEALLSSLCNAGFGYVCEENITIRKHLITNIIELLMLKRSFKINQFQPSHHWQVLQLGRIIMAKVGKETRKECAPVSKDLRLQEGLQKEGSPQ